VKRITYSIVDPLSPPTYLIDPTLDPGVLVSAGGTVSLGGIGLIESQSIAFVRGVTYWTWDELTPTFYVRGTNLPPPGRYRVEIELKNNPWGGAFYNRLFVLIRRNGLPLVVPATLLHGDNSEYWEHLTGPSIRGVGGGPESYSIQAGDVYEFCVFFSESTFTITPEIGQVRFTQLDTVPYGMPSTLAAVPEFALGVTSWDDAGIPKLTYFADSDVRLVYHSICVTNDNTVYLVLAEQVDNYATSGVNHYCLSMWKYTSGSWILITHDLTGHGVDILGTNPRVPADRNNGNVIVTRCDTDGTDVYVVWGEMDGTLGPAPHHWPNFFWRCKKYHAATNTLTELGSGQAKIPGPSRVNRHCSAGQYGDEAQIRISPDGTPWVTWVESEDRLPANETAAWAGIAPELPQLAHWDGSSWVYHTLPIGNLHDLGAGTTYSTPSLVISDDQIQVDLTFCHHDGPNNYPAVIWNRQYYDDTIVGGFAPLLDGSFNWKEFIYTEFNGSSFSTPLQFTGLDIFPSNAVTFDLDGYAQYGVIAGPAGYGSDYFGHWQQGMNLINNGTDVLFAVALGFENSFVDRVVVMKLKSDGSAFEPYISEFKQTDYLNRQIRYSSSLPQYIDWPNSTVAWVDPTGCTAVCDSNGRVWLAYTIINYFTDENPLLLVDQEPGSGFGWSFASKLNQPFISGEDDIFGFSRLFVKGSTLYATTVAWSNTRPVVFGIPTAGGGVLQFYRDGQWRVAGADSQHNVYFYRDGAWRAVGSDSEHDIYAYIGGAWTKG
jgi:hypothetical protein